MSVDLDYKNQVQSTLDKLAYSDKENNSGWKFTLIDQSLIRFKPFGSIDASSYQILINSFTYLNTEYFNHEDYLVLLFDFTNFKKATSEVRAKIIQGSIFRNEKVNFVIYGTNYFVSTIVKVISNKLTGKRLFMVKNEASGLDLGKQLVLNHLAQKEQELHRSDYYSKPNNTIEIGGNSYKMLSRKAWTYNDPTSDYSYKIDVLDGDILISRPSGYIRYQNSVMANVVFDKVVNSEIGQGKKYYRIQDYTLVSGAENKARRDFNDYLLRGINNINLLIFYGLNKTMWTVVQLGKLVHPSYDKIRIAKTFEEALEIAIANKYKKAKTTEKPPLIQESIPEYKSPQNEIAALKLQNTELKNEYANHLAILFNRISRITFGNARDYVPVAVEEGNPFYDIFSAVQLLYEDYNELKTDRDTIQLKLQQILMDHAQETKALNIEATSRLMSKENYIRTSSHEMSLTLEAILNSIHLLKQEKDSEVQESLLEIIKMSSLELQNGISQLRSNVFDEHASDILSESMFDYRKNMIQLVKVARMGHPNSKVIFENKVDELLPTFLIGDKRKFNQLVNIFLENALKYTNDGFIKIVSHVVNTSASHTRLRLIVEDSGIGMEKYTMAQIFKDELLEENEAVVQMKGIGLLIAKNLARVLDAEIGFESEKGQGSKFWIELNFNNGYHDKAAHKKTVHDYDDEKSNNILPFDGANALLILDDTIKQNLMSQILRTKGINSRIKYNYEDIDAVNGKFDFIFIYLQLTGGSEFNSVKMLKSKIDARNNSSKPIYIACVDSQIDPIMEQYRRIGIDYFIDKNIKINELDQFFEDLK